MAKSTKTVAPVKAPKTTTVKASDAIKTTVTPKALAAPKPTVALLKKIEKQIKDFEPLDLSDGLGFNAQKVYTVHNAWAKNKPLIQYLAKGLTGKLKTEFSAFVSTLDSINPNP